MTRWKPARAGIFNIWEYDDQVFEFGDGRLVLRGRNGSGKSNALSLIFPFVLDGVMSATRMDPMGGGRSMKSLLLGRDDDDANGGRYRYESGTGYVWMEFERTAEDHGLAGQHEYLTVGIGARATQQRDANAWFFVTPTRVGHGLDLADDDVPKSQRELTDSLAGNGEVYTTAEDYRAAVDRALFGLGPGRWRTLVDLLLTLRRPHLAGKLDTDHLSFTLSSGLAELDPTLIVDVAHSFDDLDAMHEELEGVSGALDAVERFLPAYRRHLLHVARQRATRLIEVDIEQRDVARQRRESDRQRDEAAEQATKSAESAERNRRHSEQIDAEIEAIQTSQAFQDAAALAEVEQRATASRRAADGAAQARHETQTQLEERVASEERVDERRRESEGRLAIAFGDWRAVAATAGLPEVSTAIDDFDPDRATAAIATRSMEVDDVDSLARAADEATADARRAAAARQRLESEDAEARRREADAALEVERVVGVLRADLEVWADGLDPIVERVRHASGRPLSRTRSALAGVDVTDTQLPGVVDAHVRTVRGAIDAATEDADRRADERTRAIDSLLVDRQRVADEPNPGPPPDPTRPAAGQADRPGVPLYVCVDFADSVAPADRAGLEAALDAAGILDARIFASMAEERGDLDAHIVLPDTDSTTVVGATLADVLVPIAAGGLDVVQIDRALRAVSIGDDFVRIQRNGSWQLGPLAGRFTKPEAEFIGHEAREQRRAARLTELDAIIASERRVLADVEQVRAELVVIAVELEAVAHARPSVEPLRSSQRSLDRCAALAQQIAERLSSAITDTEIADEIAASSSAELHRTATARSIPVDGAERRVLVDVIGECRQMRHEVVRGIEHLEQLRNDLREASAAVASAADFLTAAIARAADAEAQSEYDRIRYESLLDRVGDDVQAAVEALADAKRRRLDVRRASEQIRERMEAARIAVAKLTERCTQLEQRADVLVHEGDCARSAMAAMLLDEVADVLLIEGVESTADPLLASRAVIADLTEVPEDATNLMERAHRTVLLDGLRAGHDPSMPKLDGFDVVRVGTADGEVPIGALARRLREDRERLGLLLSEREREIFETHLLARVGDALRELLFQADHLEQRINAEMAKAPTASGMTVELSWGVDSGDPTVKQAVQTLRYSPDTMGREQREVLRAFFTEQIQDRRLADPGRSFVDVLTAALDYRNWHSFSFYIRSASGGRKQVTRKYFRELSGGEAATVLHLPLFAAAAAQYGSGSVEGPRLIALDEAFAGIDDDMRGKLMGLLVQLDLDVLLTSHEFWGFYAQVPNLVLYDLTRRPTTPGVFAQRLEWSSNEAAE